MGFRQRRVFPDVRERGRLHGENTARDDREGPGPGLHRAGSEGDVGFSSRPTPLWVFTGLPTDATGCIQARFSPMFNWMSRLGEVIWVGGLRGTCILYAHPLHARPRPGHVSPHPSDQEDIA